MPKFEARIYDDSGWHLIRLEQTDDGLSVMVDLGDREASLVLTDDRVHLLKLALARYERSRQS